MILRYCLLMKERSEKGIRVKGFRLHKIQEQTLELVVFKAFVVFSRPVRGREGDHSSH